MEALAVFQRERVKAEQLAQLRKLFTARRGQVQPEEVIALQVVIDDRFVDRRERRDDEVKLIAFRRDASCSCLADGHSGLLESMVADILVVTAVPRRGADTGYEQLSRADCQPSFRQRGQIDLIERLYDNVRARGSQQLG